MNSAVTPEEQEVALDSLLGAALQRAEPLRQHTNAYRLIDEASGEIPGLSIELYGDYAALLVYEEQASSVAPQVATLLLRRGVSGVYLKSHLVGAEGSQRGQQPSELLCGVEAPQEFAVREGEQQALIWLREGASTGLFLDQRDNRVRLRKETLGKRVLNLFCYTGAFTVAAALGGAAQTVSVDISARALGRSGDNLALNGCDKNVHRLLKDDARKWIDRATRRGDQFDWVVLDPPSFARVGSGTFKVTRDYAQLAASALQLLSPGGKMLAVLNHRGTDLIIMKTMLNDAVIQARRTAQKIEVLSPPKDCCDGKGQSATKSVIVTVLT